jgi:transposase
MEQRANIKFCFKTGKIATETFQLIPQAYGGNAVSRTRVFEWYARFRDGRENLEDDERSGRARAVRKPDIIERVRELISTDRRMSLQMIEKEFEISRETVRKILMVHLVKRFGR